MARLLRFSGFLISAFFPLTLWAANAYVIDDADIADEGDIQIEAWASGRHDHHQLVINPAYRILPNTEASLEMTHDSYQEDHLDSAAPELKYQWYKDERGLEVATAVSFTYDFDTARVSNYHVTVPVTFPLSEDWLLHANIGWEHDRDNPENLPILGLNSEYHFNPEWAMIGEAFRADDGRLGVQFGPHYTPMEDVEIDLLYGYHVDADDGHLMTLGVTFAF